ncbi:MAG TPA: ATP-binding protein [Feifaniaceae bacterium]|nr:ATP-binding protein [Feifaniaceae bacterium]
MPSWNFRGTFSNPDEMHLVVTDLLIAVRERFSVQEETWYDLKLIVYELCRNALEHGKIPAEVSAGVCRKDCYLHVLVSDSGEGFCPEDCPQANLEEERGRGLSIVHSLADKIIFNSAANKVLVKLHIS